MNDVAALLPLVSRNEDDSPNFNCQIRTSDLQRVERRTLLEAVDALLAPGADVALFYFAGHGARADNDVVLYAQDGKKGDQGLALSIILGRVQESPVSEVIIILDCCFAGGAGGVPQLGADVAVLRHGVSLLMATRDDQTAAETTQKVTRDDQTAAETTQKATHDDQKAAETTQKRGLFSTYLCGALEGGAADVLGKVTIANLYAYLSESFSPWDQRPTFKANVERLNELRQCSPAVPFSELRRLPEIFPDPDGILHLDPSYEPTAEPKDSGHEAVFSILQRCRAAKLVVPVGADHLYFAAMQSKGCKLTPLGKLYWGMANQKRI